METRRAFSGALNIDTSTWLISSGSYERDSTNNSDPPPLCLYDIHRLVIKIVYLAGLWSIHQVQTLQRSPQSCHKTEDKTE